MGQPLHEALAQVRARLLDPETLVRAVASGRQRGHEPPWRRVELRYVDLKAGRHLQVTAYDATQAHTANHAVGGPAATAVEGLLDQPFGNWHLETATETLQLRVTKKREALVHTTARTAEVAVDHGHDREKERLVPADDPLWRALGLAGGDGRIKPSRQAKWRQVEEFLRVLDGTVTEALAAGHLRRPTAEDPLRLVDLGCGNGYLTFAAHHLLRVRHDLPVRVIGVDSKQQSCDHNTEVAGGLGLVAGTDAEFVVGTIRDAPVAEPPDVVLALHACDTATDEALARAVGWQAPVVLAAPCCHHDIAAQLRTAPDPRAVRAAHPPRHPARATGRHAHRRVARSPAAARGLPRRRDGVRRQRAHAAQHPAAGGAHRRSGGRRRPPRVRRPGGCVVGAPAAGRPARRPRGGLVRRRLEALGVAVAALPFGVGAVVAAAQAPDDETRVVFRWQDEQIVESSGLAVVDGLFVTVNDSGDSGRTFVVDPDTGRTVGGAAWSETPVDVEALAPMPDGSVLVGDMGGNNQPRDSVSVLEVPLARGFTDVTPRRHVLTYPDGTHDAETLLVHPVTGRVYVVTKSFEGGVVYAAPGELSPDGSDPLTPVGVLPGYLTDGAFFPDGKHVVVRKYVGATVHAWPSLEQVGELRLPAQQQGEAIAVARDGRVFVSTEGQFSAVHRVDVPPELAAVVLPDGDAAPTPSQSPSEDPTQEPSPSPSESSSPTAEASEPAGTSTEEDAAEEVEVTRSPWIWWLGGLVGIGIVVVLLRSLRPR